MARLTILQEPLRLCFQGLLRKSCLICAIEATLGIEKDRLPQVKNNGFFILKGSLDSFPTIIVQARKKTCSPVVDPSRTRDVDARELVLPLGVQGGRQRRAAIREPVQFIPAGFFGSSYRIDAMIGASMQSHPIGRAIPWRIHTDRIAEPGTIPEEQAVALQYPEGVSSIHRQTSQMQVKTRHGEFQEGACLLRRYPLTNRQNRQPHEQK